MLALPPLECLRYFDAAARHQSFVRAAEELHVTPAAVAHRIKMLERHLRAPLFDRRHRGVSLNARGRLYHADIERIFAELLLATERHHRARR